MVNTLGTRRALLSVTAALALGCAPAAPAPKAPEGKRAAAVATAEPTPPLPQPTVAQRAGRVARETRPPVALSVTGKEVTADGVYLEVSLESLPLAERFIFTQSFVPCGDPLPGSRPVQVVQRVLHSRVSRMQPVLPLQRTDAGQRPEDGADTLLVRLAGTAPIPPRLDLTLRGCSSRPSWSSGYSTRAGFEQSLTLALQANTPVRRGIAARFLEEYSEVLLEWAGSEKQSHFGCFASGRLRQAALRLTVPPSRAKGASHNARGGADALSVDAYDRARFGDDSGDLAELMDFYTGRSQLLAAMAIQRGLGKVSPGQPRIKLSTLKGVTAPTRNYDALIEALPNPSGQKLDPLAKHLPADALIAEFGTLRDLVTLGRDLDQRFGAITQALEGTPGPNWLQERYREQLAVEVDVLAEKLGHLAVGSVALVLSDPYLREGSDVSLVFEVRDQALFAAALEAHGKRAKANHPDLTESRVTIDGRSVLLLSTPDGSIRRYQIELPRVTVLTNSHGAMKRLLAVQDGRAKGLASSPDYRYARTVKPYDGLAESASVFLGDAFMAQITGPRSKILEARRVRAQLELQAVDSAALLFGWMQGEPPSSLQQLVESPWLAPEDLKHSDGSPIRWTPERGASSRWGTTFHLSPIIDQDVDLVTKAEQSAYERFRSGYESGWRLGVDPTLVRLMRRDDGRILATEVTLLPINALSRSNREYDEMSRLVGSGAIEGRAMPDGAAATLAIGKDSRLRTLAEDGLRLFGRGKDLGLSFVGDWVQLGVADRAAVWDFTLSASDDTFSLPRPAGSKRAEPRPEAIVERLVGTLPVWAAVHVRNPLLLAATLTALRAMVSEAAPGLASWNKDAPYRGVEITRVDGQGEGVSVSVHYGVVNSVLLVALQREVLERRIDSVLEGRVPAASPAGQGHQFLTTVKPEAGGVFRRLLALLLDHQALSAHRAAARGHEILRRGLGASAVSGDARRSLALRHLGYEPDSPQGGALRWTSDGLVEHPAYGSDLEPAIPDAANPTLALHQVINAIGALSGAVRIENRANERELHGKIEVRFAQ